MRPRATHLGGASHVAPHPSPLPAGEGVSPSAQHDRAGKRCAGQPNTRWNRVPPPIGFQSTLASRAIVRGAGDETTRDAIRRRVARSPSSQPSPGGRGSTTLTPTYSCGFALLAVTAPRDCIASLAMTDGGRAWRSRGNAAVVRAPASRRYCRGGNPRRPGLFSPFPCFCAFFAVNSAVHPRPGPKSHGSGIWQPRAILV